MCAWTPFCSRYPTNQLSFGLDVTAHVTILLPEGSPEMFLVPSQPPDAMWQCWEEVSPRAGAAGVEREGATAQGWGGLGDSEPHPDTTDSAVGFQDPLKTKGSLEGWCNASRRFSAGLGGEGLQCLTRLWLGQEKVHPGALAAGGISTLHAGLCHHSAGEGTGAARGCWCCGVCRLSHSPDPVGGLDGQLAHGQAVSA